jgi:hypothetical protein
VDQGNDRHAFEGVSSYRKVKGDSAFPLFLCNALPDEVEVSGMMTLVEFAALVFAEGVGEPAEACGIIQGFRKVDEQAGDVAVGQKTAQLGRKGLRQIQGTRSPSLS